MVSYDVDGAIVTNCTVEYIGDSFPASGATITNAITANSAYNGTATSSAYSEYGTGLSGAKRWYLTANIVDSISTPLGTLTNNVAKVTWEFGFYLDAITTDEDVIFSKGPVDWTIGPIIGIYPNGSLEIFRATTNGYRSWQTAVSTLAAGHYYFLQITWDMTGTEATPVCMLSVDDGASASKGLTLSTSGNSTTWSDDSAYNQYIGTLNGTDSAASYEFFLFRQHNDVLVANDLTTNFSASKWRLATSPPSGWNETVVPTSTTASNSPHSQTGPDTIGCA